MKLIQHTSAVLTEDLPAERLVAGDAGTMGHVHCEHSAHEVEFLNMTGGTVAVAPVRAAQLRPVGTRGIAHAFSHGNAGAGFAPFAASREYKLG